MHAVASRAPPALALATATGAPHMAAAAGGPHAVNQSSLGSTFLASRLPARSLQPPPPPPPAQPSQLLPPPPPPRLPTSSSSSSSSSLAGGVVRQDNRRPLLPLLDGHSRRSLGPAFCTAAISPTDQWPSQEENSGNSPAATPEGSSPAMAKDEKMIEMKLCSLFKLREFFRNVSGTNGSSHVNKYQAGPGSGLEDHRPGSMDSSQMHNMYGNHGNRSNSSSSNSPPVSATTTSSSMLVVPQPINAVAKPSLNAAAAVAAAANGSGRKYQCKMCPQIFLHKSAMQHHAREVHRGELKPHQCQQCLKSFSSNHQLVQHIRIHTGEKPYKCSYCDRRFKQLSHVQQHTRLHTGERPYKCHLPECGRAFIQLSNLQQHLRNHDSQVERSKNRPFHCNICGKGFASESSLRTHTSKQHAALIGGQNSQSCPVCHKMFLGSEALMDHMRTTHKDPNATGVASKRRTANHPCPVCGKTYVNEGSLRKHIASHPETSNMTSPLRMWPCSVCQSVFTQESGLLSHMEHMRMDPKHQFAAQYVLSRAAAERRERESLLAAAAAAVAAASAGNTSNGLQPPPPPVNNQNDHHNPGDPRSQPPPPPPPPPPTMGMPSHSQPGPLSQQQQQQQQQQQPRKEYYQH